MGTEFIHAFSSPLAPHLWPLARLAPRARPSPPTFAKPTAGTLAFRPPSVPPWLRGELSESQTFQPLALQKALQRLLGPHAEALEILVKADRHGALCRRLRRQRTIRKVYR